MGVRNKGVSAAIPVRPYLRLAANRRVRGVNCLGLAGVVTDAAKARRLFAATHALTPEFVPREQALTDTAACLERLAAHAARLWKE